MIRKSRLLFSEYARSEYPIYRDLSAGSVYQLRRSAEIFESWAGWTPVDEITERDLSLCLHDLRDRYSPKTLHRIRGDWLTLLRGARRDGLRRRRFKFSKVRRVKKPRPNPQAYTPEQMQILVAAMLAIPGVLQDGLRKRGEYFAAFCKLAYEVGSLRKGDIHGLEQHDFLADGTVAKVQSKTGVVGLGRVEPDTLALVRRLGPQPFRWIGNRSRFWHWWEIGRVASGLPKLAATKTARKSGATAVAREQPGAETRFLGHTTPTADQHYIDLRLATTSPPRPTRITVAIGDAQ